MTFTKLIVPLACLISVALVGQEPNSDVHIVGRNASDTKAAKFVVVLVKDKGAPLLVPAN